MAKTEQVKRLQQGIQQWNTWRQNHPDETIDLSNTDLTKADLTGADLFRANLTEANLTGADLTKAYLTGANLTGADLFRTDLTKAYLTGANLTKADLIGADLIGADLKRADLTGDDLTGANLTRTDLTGANLTGANLTGTNFTRTNLTGTNLSNTRIGLTIFGNVDLRTVKGLETIQHIGPSTIGTDTLERSEGHIPDIFLQNAGLNDTIITYARSLIQSHIQYYTCFISYSSKDELFAKRLHNDLQQEGVRCWFAPENMDIGDKIRYRIEESIRLYDKLLLILSEHSIASNWVEYEVERALNKEPQGIPNVLYPVRVDQAIMTCSETWARDIKSSRHIGNFEDWTDPQHYEENFKRLLRALNTKKE